MALHQYLVNAMQTGTSGPLSAAHEVGSKGRSLDHTLSSELITRVVFQLTFSLQPDEVIFWADRSVAPRQWTLAVRRTAAGTYRVTNEPMWDPLDALDGTCWTTNFKTADRDSPSHARLLVRRSIHFAADEVAYLELLASDIEHLVGVRREKLMREALRSAASAVASEHRLDQRPGTLAAIAVGHLTTALKADIGGYFSFDGSAWCAEYMATRNNGNKAPYAKEPSIRSGDHPLQAALRRGRPFYWSDLNFLRDELGPGAFAHSVAREGGAVSRAIILPVTHQGDAVGFLCFAYSSERGDLPSKEVVSLLGNLVRPWGGKLVYLAQRRFKHVYIDPIYSGRDTRIESGKCAVLMPFSEGWSDRIWSRVLQPRLVALGFTPIRADDLYGRDIMEDIWQMILSAEVVLADITGRNANVFYELGLAHALGKEVVLLTQATDDIPFDLNRYRHIVYKDNLDGYDLLTKGLTGALTEVIARRGPRVTP